MNKFYKVRYWGNKIFPPDYQFVALVIGMWLIQICGWGWYCWAFRAKGWYGSYADLKRILDDPTDYHFTKEVSWILVNEPLYQFKDTDMITIIERTEPWALANERYYVRCAGFSARYTTYNDKWTIRNNTNA